MQLAGGHAVARLHDPLLQAGSGHAVDVLQQRRNVPFAARCAETGHHADFRLPSGAGKGDGGKKGERKNGVAKNRARGYSEQMGLPEALTERHYGQRRRGLVARPPVRSSAAARRLVDGEQDILGLALEAGYGSHEAFTRAFGFRSHGRHRPCRNLGAAEGLKGGDCRLLPA
ncbi:hypothetical protein FQZ97_887980 [compost metagenome]